MRIRSSRRKMRKAKEDRARSHGEKKGKKMEEKRDWI